MRTTVGTAQQLHLTRAARTAGEAFAFDEPENLDQPSRTRKSTTLFWLGLAAAALAALYFITR